MSKGKKAAWGSGPSRLSFIRRSERLWAIENEVREVLGWPGPRGREHLAHRVAIYVLKRRFPNLSLPQMAEEAGHGCHTDMLFAIVTIRKKMGEDAELAEKIDKLCPAVGE